MPDAAAEGFVDVTQPSLRVGDLTRKPNLLKEIFDAFENQRRAVPQDW